MTTTQQTDQAAAPPTAEGDQLQYDLVVVGAGFAGMYMLHRARTAGFSVHVYEAGSGVGGTWYWNRYPGARCDVESLEYSYSFSKELRDEWEWPERYSGQPDIERYANHVADRFDLRRDIQFETRVTSAVFDEAQHVWAIATSAGDRVRARYLIMATGCLSAVNLPNIPGRDSFVRESYHTGQWPKEPVSFAGKRVAVIGTGSSGVQSVPVIASQAASLTVFQRTPSYSLPSANGPIPVDEVQQFRANFEAIHAANLKMPGGTGSRFTAAVQGSVLQVPIERRSDVFGKAWTAGGFSFMRSFSDIATSHEANGVAAGFVKEKIRELVRDQETAELLCPEIPIGCKRMIIDSGYYETFNMSHVTLCDARIEPIEAITATGVRTVKGDYEFDMIVFATGFDAMVGSLTRIDIQGRAGLQLRDAWEAGPRTYLGLAVTDFPNLFTITGPGSPSVLTNMMVSIEQHVDWITNCLEYVRERGASTIEPTLAAQEAWVDHVNDVATRDIMHTAPSCDSWYLGSNIPGKPRVFMPLPGLPAYIERCNQVAAAGYEGFVLA